MTHQSQHPNRDLRDALNEHQHARQLVQQDPTTTNRQRFAQSVQRLNDARSKYDRDETK